MADTNPFDALDDQPGSAPTEASSAVNPFDALDEAPAQDRTAARMREVTDQAQMPEVTVSARRPGPEATWSQVMSGASTAIGAGIEKKVAGAQEYIGRTAYDDARKKFWQATILPDAVRDAQKRNVALGDLPIVQDAARHLGIRPDVFTRDWPTYVNETDANLNAFKSDQRDRIQTGAQQIASGTRKRLSAQEVQEAYAPRMDPHSMKAFVFDAATMAPDILAGVGGTVATGGVGGAAIMAADIAPGMYAEARNRGLDHNQASTYAVLSTVASSVPEIPVLKIVQNTPLAKKVIGSVVGDKLAATGVGKVAATAAAQGVTQSVVSALQQGIDAGVLNEHLPLDEALKQVAWSGLLGAAVGAPMGAYHAAATRTPKPVTFRDINEQRLEPTIGDLGGIGNNEPAPEAAGEGVQPTESTGEAAAPESAGPQGPGNNEPSVAPPSMERRPQEEAAAPPHETTGEAQAAPPAIDTSAEEKAGATEKKVATQQEEHAALQATKDKTVTPPQAEMLENLGLIKRNDLGEPVLLPKGRRRLTALDKEAAAPASEAPSATQTGGEKEAETGPIEPETGAKAPVSEPEAPKEAPKTVEMTEKPRQLRERAPQPPSERASALHKRIADDEDLRSGLVAMKGETGWAQIGGRLLRDATTGEATGRTTWIPHADWWPGRPKGLKEDEVHAAVDKAVSGQPMGKREVDTVEYMEQVHRERVAMAQTHQELTEAVPNLEEQPRDQVDLTMLAERAGFHDVDATMKVIDTWQDDHPETLARIRHELEGIIGRGQQQQTETEGGFSLAAQEGRAAEPAPAPRSPAALDLFGEDRTREQALADETRRRDALRSPNRDVPLETGLPGDLFSQARRQVDLEDAARAAKKSRPTQVSFRTAKGSTYVVDEQGRTTRNKAARSEHPGEAGPQPQSEATYYVSPEDSEKLLEHLKTSAHPTSLFPYPDGKIGLRYESGPSKFKVERRTVVPTKGKPAKGLVPVETWKDGKSIHVGHEIVDVEGPTGQESFLDTLEAARDGTHTEPTPGQKEAGNYRKGRLDFAGMEVALENPKGSIRSGRNENGTRWSRKMAHDYGYITGSEGKDGDAVDVFLTGKPDTGKVFVVNQVNPETGRFDEHKAILGAESVDEARQVYEDNYPKGWKGEESIAELTTPDFRKWVESKGPARGPIRPPSKLERRADAGKRKKVSEMSDEEVRRELLTHELTGIPNRRAYTEAEKLPHQVSIDVDSLKWVNDNMGHESGNELLKAIASSLSSHSDNVFHLSGDEFAAQAHTETEAHELMRQVSEHLQNARIEVEMPDGRLVTMKGMGVSYGVGKTIEEADAALAQHKARRQAAGERAGRGETPPGATVRAREEGRQDQTGGPAESVKVEENAAKYSPGVLLAPSGRVEGGTRARVAPGQGSLDFFAPAADPVPVTRAARALAQTRLVSTGHYATGIKHITGWRDVAHLIAPLRKQPQESLMAVVTDHDGKVLGVIRHTTGTSSQSLIESGVLMGAVARIPGARQVWFAHNHPGGDVSQSPEDKTATDLLEHLTRGTGIRNNGMVVVGPGNKLASFYHPREGAELVDFVRAKARDQRQAILERRYRKVPGRQEGERVISTTDAVNLAEASGLKSGLMLFDAKIRHLATLPMSAEEMNKLRTGDPSTGAMRVLQEVERTTAVSAIPFGKDVGGIANLTQMLQDAKVNVLDAIHGEPGHFLSNGKAVNLGGRRAFFRRTEGEQGGGLPRHQVESIVRGAVREAGLQQGFPHVEVHDDVSTLPAHIRDLVERQEAAGTTGAVYDPRTGRIHLIADNNGSEQEVRENLWHEAVGHHGLRLAMDRPQYNAIMDGIARDMPERVEASARRNGLDLTDLAEKRAAAEEVVAYAAGQHLSGQAIDKPLLPWFKRAARAVKAFFSRLTGKPFYDDNAIAGLIQQAHRALEEGGAGTTPGEPSRSTRAPMFYSAVERAIETNKQGKASGEQWLATIKATKAVKPEELEWLDLENWLRGQKSVTRGEVLDYVRAHKLELTETQYGAGTQTEDERQQIQRAEELRALGYEVSFDQGGNLSFIGIPDRESGVMRRYDIEDRERLYEALEERGGGELSDKVENLENFSTRVAMLREAERTGENTGYDTYDNTELDTTRGAQYGDYTLPGGENYRELLLQLPDTERSRAQAKYEALRDKLINELRESGVADEYATHAEDTVDALESREKLKPEVEAGIKGKGIDGLRQEFLEAHRAATHDEASPVDHFIDRMAERYGYENVFDMRTGQAELKPNFEDLLTPEERAVYHSLEKQQPQPPYRSSHWMVPNVLAHVRFKERVDQEGRRVLHVEEIQSDWHQAGRDRGYRSPEHVEQISNLRREVSKAKAAYAEAVEQQMAERDKFEITRKPGSEPAEWKTAAKTRAALYEKLQAAERALQEAERVVPQAPFKTTWPMLVMKRMIRWAAENAFERLVWTRGEQHVQRYNLENHLDWVRAERLTDNEGRRTYFISARHPEGAEVGGYGRKYKEEDLPAVVGHELAAKIAAQPEGVKTYSGLDLRVGGEGMRGFYDDILPRETNKLIKKYGAKVELAPIDDNPRRIADFEKRAKELEERITATPLSEVRDNPEYDRDFMFLQSIRRQLHEMRQESIGSLPGFDITPEMRQAALGEGFPMFSRRQQPLPIEENRERGAYAAVRRAVNAVHGSKMVRDVRKLVNPVGMSAESKQTAQIARAALGELAHETVKTQEALEAFSRQVDRMPIEDQLEMMDAIERGAEQPHPELQPVADEMRKILDTWREKVRGLGEGYLDNFIENYFPHYWREPSEAQRMVASIMGRRPLRGPASFLKMRTIPSIKEGMDVGLTPLTTNPLIMTLLKTREMQRFVTGVTLMRRFKEDGLAQFLPAMKPMPDGWAPINDNIAKVKQWSEAEGGFIDRGQYIMPLEAARVINNHVSASALRDFAPAQIFRRGANALNAMQLGFSAFHLGFTTLDAMISKNAQGIERLLHGDVAGAARSFGEGVTPVGAVRNVRRGYKLLQAYTNPAGATPEMAKLVQALEQAGGRAHMDRYYLATEGFTPFRGVGIRSLASDVHKALTAPQDKLERLGEAVKQFPAEYANKLWRGTQEIWQTTPKLEVPIEMAMRVVRASTSWIMEHLVPMQKLGVFSDLASDHLARNPNEDPNERAAAMQRIWDSVDNRLGEMVYDNVFWNRTLKDSLHLGVRAVGWNLGTIREIAGAPIDIVKAVDKKIRTGEIKASDLGHRIPYVLAMTATTALYASVYQYLATGQGPQELKDYFFPKTGGTTNYGTPQRVSLPSYVKDVYEYSQRPGTTVVNKLNPIFSLLGNLYSNQDFFGNPITDPEASYWHQKLQQLQFVGKEATPFSFQGRQQMQQTDQEGGLGATVKKVLPMVGVTPAPGYITSGEQLERRQRLEDDQKYTKELKYQMKKAGEAGDKDKQRELAKEYVEAVKRMNQTKALVEQDRAKAAAARRKAATKLRQSGHPATANLVESLPLEPDEAARRYFAQQAAA